MLATIHQPEHLPWLGFFHKAAQCDVLVLLDHVQYRKNYFQNRNRIRTARGFSWLTVPVRKGSHKQPLNEVRVASEQADHWPRKHWASLEQAYRRAPFFELYAQRFEEIYSRRWQRLAALNEQLIRALLDGFGIEVRVLKSSDFKTRGRKGELLVDICRQLGATGYLSGISGPDYFDADLWRQAGIDLHIQRFEHPVYRQIYAGFESHMSAIDLLFNHGPDSLEILTSDTRSWVDGGAQGVA